MSYVQPWMMHPSSDHALPQVGNLPISSYSSRGSPESSDYGSGSMSVIDMLATDLANNARESQAHSKDHFLLRDQLQQQIEYYFSPQNLAKDTFLRSQMDGDHYVLVSLIAGFNCVRRLTQDLNLITDAIRVSSKLELDDISARVRPKSNRSTVVIHDLPDTVTREDLEGLFAKQTVVKPVNYECASTDGSCWYVEFEQESEAKEALRYLREDVRDYGGKPIGTRIRAIPVAAASVAAYKGNDVGHMASVASPVNEDSVHMVRAPGSEMLQYPQYAFPAPNGQFYTPNMMHPQVNPGFLMWPSPINYQDVYNMMAYNSPLMQMQPVPPPPYRGGHNVSRGRGGGGRRGNSNTGYNGNNRRGRGESYPNSGRNSAMSETRSEHNHAASQAVNNRDNSRHGSVSSVNGNHRGAMSPSSVRSGENTPPHGPPVTVTASSQTRERAGSVANSIERRNSVSDNSKRYLESQAAQGKHGDNIAHVAQLDHAKANQSKFDFEPKMFPPLPGMQSSSVNPDSQDQSESTANVSQTNNHSGSNMSAADIVRGVHGLNVNSFSKAWSEGDVNHESSEKSSKLQRVDQVRSQKKEQGSSTDDLPKSGREQNEQKTRVEPSTARTSRSNSSASTQTLVMSVVPNSQAPTSLHGPNLRPGPSSASTSGARQEAEHLPQTFKDLSPGSTSSKTYNSLSVGTDSTHPGHSDSGSGRSSAASHKESEDRMMAGRSDASKCSSVENGKGSGTISYARVAQMNRDKLLVPGQAAGYNGPHAVPLMKQSSVDSSQDDRRSLVDKEHSISSVGSRSQPSSVSGQDGRVQSARRTNDNLNGYDGLHPHQNGSASSAGPSDAGNHDDNEGYVEVTKHKHVQRPHPQRSNGTIPRRYAGGL